jgi:hypothetical protein
MTVQLPGDLKDGKLGGDPKEELPSVAAEAPILIEQAGISEAKLQDDWKPKTAPEAVPVVIPAHHLQQAYNKLQAGATVEEAARIAAVPVEKVMELAAEVVAVCTKLGSEVPENVKAKAKVEPGPVEPIEEIVP